MTRWKLLAGLAFLLAAASFGFTAWAVIEIQDQRRAAIEQFAREDRRQAAMDRELRLESQTQDCVLFSLLTLTLKAGVRPEIEEGFREQREVLRERLQAPPPADCTK